MKTNDQGEKEHLSVRAVQSKIFDKCGVLYFDAAKIIRDYRLAKYLSISTVKLCVEMNVPW